MWEAWRVAYPTMTFQEQKEFYRTVWRENRDQHGFNLPAFKRALHMTSGWPIRVVELGGWDGELALLGMTERISTWTNYEICEDAVNESLVEDERYQAVLLEDWFWRSRYECDLFVACHVLEHLTLADVRRTLDAVKFWYAFVEAPLRSDPISWSGYQGSHILEVGWDGLDEEFFARGYSPVVITPESRLYRPRTQHEVLA
jgi:hypothetical protein